MNISRVNGDDVMGHSGWFLKERNKIPVTSKPTQGRRYELLTYQSMPGTERNAVPRRAIPSRMRSSVTVEKLRRMTLRWR